MPAGELVVFGGGAGPRPLGAKTSVAVHGEKVYVSEGSTPVLRIYSTTGKELKHLQLPLTPVRADTASFSRAVDDLVEQIHGPNRDRVRERLLRTPMPENLPVMQSMTADGNGGLWIVSPSSGGQGSRIVVLDADGAIVAEKQMAVSVVALGGGAGRFLATYMDSRGTPRLVVLRVEAAR